MDRNHYVQDRVLDFFDEFDQFVRETLTTAFGATWFEDGVAPHVGKKYLERVKRNLTNPLRSVDQLKNDNELYGVEHLQNIIRGNRELFAKAFRDCDRACIYLAEIAEVRHALAHRTRKFSISSIEVRRSEALENWSDVAHWLKE